MLRAIITLTILSASLLNAQNVSSSLAGIVQDSSGAAFPGAEITLTENDTGFVRTTKTNSEGFFSLPDLKSATYRLAVSATGFKRYEQTGIALTSSEQRTLGTIRLEVGAVSESIQVTAEANPVMLNSGERTGVLTNDDIQSIAARGRDIMDAVGLLPGVTDVSGGREAPSGDSLKQIYILGGREDTKNMTVDGISAVDAGNSAGVMIMPSMDAVSELKVLMSNYSAEYGRKSGGTVSIITKGGGRQFHGSAGWYFRNEALNANNFFNNRNGVDRPRYRYNIGGYSLSGPLYIPGKFNSDRSKLFFFFSQEFQRQLVNNGTKTVRVPTELERGGDFSQTYDVNGKLVPVNDPLNGKKQFPGNVVPQSRLTTVGSKILNLFPYPNFVDPAPSRRYQWNYLAALSSPYPRRTETARVDYSPKANLQLYWRFTNTVDQQNIPWGSWIAGSVNYPLTKIFLDRPSQGWVGHATMTFSPTLFNEVSAGVTKNKLVGHPADPSRVSRAATGIDVPMWNPAMNPAGLIPNMSFGGVSNAANPSMYNPMPYYTDCRIFSMTDNMTKIAGTHMLKAGVYLERMAKDQFSGGASRGAIAFDRDTLNPLDSNFAYANALMGNYDTYSESTAQPMGLYRFFNLEFFGQDTWRVNSRLTLDHGVRFYRDMPMHDARNQISTFVPGLYNPANAPVLLRPGFDSKNVKSAVDPISGAIYPQGFIGTYAPGRGNSAEGMVVAGTKGFSDGLYTVPTISAAPRFGFAWDPFGKGRTSVRGGAGLFYDRIAGNPTMDQLANPPGVYVPKVYYGTLADLAQTAGQKILAPSNINSLFGQAKLPTVYNFSMGIQHNLGRTSLVDLSYVGSLSRHFLWKRNINPVPIGATHMELHPENRDPTTTNSSLANNFLRPYQGYGDISLYEFAATSNYHSLQAAYMRRMSRGVQLSLAYTFSKALGSVDSNGDSVSPFFAPRRWDYGPLGFDRSHVFSARYTWILPKPGRMTGSKKLAVLTDGWEIAGITKFFTGAPFTPGFSLVNGQDITGTASQGARIVVLDPTAPARQRFGPPASNTFGNAGSNILRQPGVNNWDLSVYRRFHIRERLNAQLRFESYNTFNHTQYSGTSNTARFDNTGAQIDPLFLEPTSARDPRRLQVALRLSW